MGSDTQGLVVAGVDQNADAARKNLRRGDIILSANYREVTTLEQLEAIIETAEDEGRDAVLLREHAPRVGLREGLAARVEHLRSRPPRWERWSEVALPPEGL